MLRKAGIYLLGSFLIFPSGRSAAENGAPAELILSSGPPQAGAVEKTDEGSVFFVGNATVILKAGPFTILTDPNFVHSGEHVHLGYGLKAKRLTSPAIEIEALPAIDFLLVSHFHGDHFDQIAEEKLDKEIPIIIAKDGKDELEERGFRHVYGLETWESIIVRKGEASLKITAMPAKHAPLLMQPMIPDVIGSMIEYQTGDRKKGIRIYISGDTLIHDELREIPKRFPAIDLGLFHLGGTRLFGVLLTMDAKQGIEAVRITNPAVAIPVHYNDYDVFKSSLEDFKEEVRQSGHSDKVVYLQPGETYGFKLKETPKPQAAAS